MAWTICLVSWGHLPACVLSQHLVHLQYSHIYNAAPYELLRGKLALSQPQLAQGFFRECFLFILI